MTNFIEAPSKVSFPWKKAAPRLRLHRWARGSTPRAPRRYFFVMFQNTGTGATIMPSTLVRSASG